MGYIFPDHTDQKFRPEPGDLIWLRHEVWRVIEVRDKPESDWTEDDHARIRVLKKSVQHERRPFNALIRPVGLDDELDPVKVRNATRSISYRGRSPFPTVHVYRSEHYPVCARCGDPTPCREVLVARDSDRAVKRMARYEDPDRCPACEGVITNRQRSVTFDVNLRVPLGPPVSFHLRQQCRREAANYEKEWSAADPANRQIRLSCPGWVTTHRDDTFTCTAGGACPGGTTFHAGNAMCSDPGCCSRDDTTGWDCHVWPHYTQRMERAR